MSTTPETGPPKGLPIYEDDRARGVVDSLEDDAKCDAWYPSNTAALKLWHCLEALRDIELILADASAQKNANKRKRQLKMFSVQLVSLACAVVQLCDLIVGDKSLHKDLPPQSSGEVASIKKELLGLVPIDWNGDLATIRNKLGGHIDAKLWPWQTAELMSRADISSFGRWLHVCVHVILDLMKLDIYAWTCSSGKKDLIRIMSNEPYLVTFAVKDGELHSLVGLHLSKRSPRESIVDVIRSVVANSQWMFRSGERRIASLHVDDSRHWNTFSGQNAKWHDR